MSVTFALVKTHDINKEEQNNMKMSETVSNLGKSLVAFNGEIQKIAHDGRNPQFRSKYVTLDTLIEATKPILQKHGLSVLQIPLSGEQDQVGVKSLLLHESGEFIESEPLFMTPQRMLKGGEYVVAKDAQAAGSTISYLRRYSYQAILNLSTGEDDDGESAVGRGNNPARERTETNTQAEESGNADKEESSTDDGGRRGRRYREVSEDSKQEAATTPTEETSRRGSRRGQTDAASTPQSEESTGDSENTSRRGRRNRT